MLVRCFFTIVLAAISFTTTMCSQAGPMVSAGARHALILKADGSVWITGQKFVEDGFGPFTSPGQYVSLTGVTMIAAMENGNASDIFSSLNDLINNYTGMSDKTKMHFLRNLRNKVHPNNISATQDVTRKEAIEARNFLEQILKLI